MEKLLCAEAPPRVRAFRQGARYREMSTRGEGAGESGPTRQEDAASANSVPSQGGSAEFQEVYGESLARALDLSTWQVGVNLEELYARWGDAQVAEALRYEADAKPLIRQHIFSRISMRKQAPPEAGVYLATRGQIERTHKGLLFTGAVEAADGTYFSHETIPLTVNQIGVCTISYHGDQGTYVHRLFRRDLRAGTMDSLDKLLEMLDKRMSRDAIGAPEPRDSITQLASIGLMSYAERAVLLDRCKAPWRMGHGNPAPFELLTGSGSMELLEHSLDVLRRLLLDHKQWVFVPSAPKDRFLLSIGQALNPLEYAIVETGEQKMNDIVEKHGYDPYHTRMVREFVREVGPRTVRGVYRASRLSPPYVFYAHAECAHEAALIALADSTMHEHRGFPMLIDLADRICAGTFGSHALATQMEVSYAAQGVPFEYLPERYTRKG